MRPQTLKAMSKVKQLVDAGTPVTKALKAAKCNSGTWYRFKDKLEVNKSLAKDAWGRLQARIAEEESRNPEKEDLVKWPRLSPPSDEAVSPEVAELRLRVTRLKRVVQELIASL